MKKIIIASTVLLCAGGIYGFIDYNGQYKDGKLNNLYKDDVYNEKATALIGANVVSKKDKDFDMDDFSRAPLREDIAIIDDKDVAIGNENNEAKKVIKKKVNASIARKEMKAAIEDDYEKVFVKAEYTDTVKLQPKVMYLASSEDSIAYRKKEAKDIKMAMFSRAPIRRKPATVIIVSADSSVVAEK